MDSFSGRTVLVTGAAGAVGQACARALRARGAGLVLSDRIKPADTGGDQDLFLPADVTDRAAVQAAFVAAVEPRGRIDAVVLAAGIEGAVGAVENLSEADLDQALAVNLKGALFWMQAVLPHMKANRAGSIVALASISGVVGSAGLAAYVMSKHALVGLVRTAALEAQRHGVRVNAVCPGPIASPMMDRLDAALTAREPGRVSGVATYAAVDDVAAMVAFLCGDGSASCNGGTFMIDGGFTAR